MVHKQDGPIVAAKGLTKEFQIFKSRPGLMGAIRDLFNREHMMVNAVNHIDLLIQPGEIVGYIGSNGAGKSTTIKMLTGILMPTSGNLSVNGMVPYENREAFVRTIGVVFGQRSQLWWDIAVRESFELLRKVYRVPLERYQPHMAHIIETLDLEELLDKPVRKLSLGQRMRCELAASLVHNPRLLFLDEPTIGLDVMVKLRIREFLKEMNEQYGTTIMLTTHDIGDIEALCSRVVMLDKGNIIYDGTLSELRAKWAGERAVRVSFADRVKMESLHRIFVEQPVVIQRNHELEYEFLLKDPSYSLSNLMTQLAAQFQVRDLAMIETSTEEIVRHIYEGGRA
ncbi:ATP-binding cassette domain-containing protein [Fodinisporobacter ferrooxydans]|uniref:ATP-binding cassette domain-containing protein n=1 Tax=Fodinisporobacter ferrooxydans TaxID=2901836 RepID=A0ABY4CL83_9BACL|nr:ATP-binding cassette domain-containing protein [Alicyclobacillaceae bacterium MYW30-H2]